MNQGRLVNVVRRSWGTACIFSFDQKSEISIVKDRTESAVTVASLSRRVQSRKSLQSISTIPESIREKRDSDEDERFSVSFFMASLYCTLLEDMLTELKILDQCSNELKIIKTQSDLSNLRKKKFGVVMPVVDELDGIDRSKLNCTVYKVRKLDADRQLVNNLMESLYLELAFQQSYSTLSDKIQQMKDLNNYCRFMLQEEAKNKLIRRDLLKQLRQQRNSIKLALYETNSTISDLRTRVEDSALYCEAGSRYTEKWETARTEQHSQYIFDKERIPLETIMYYKQRTEHEHRVHTEVELLTNIVITETLTKVEDWMAKYDKDMEKLDLKIQLKKNDYQMMADKTEEMEIMLEDHRNAMQAWVDFKDRREKARLYREKMTKAATIVQAWWRGLLVRLQLGPFKAKKADKKGKKK